MSLLTFKDYGHSESGKTKRFAIVNASNETLGWIRWYGAWRRYTVVKFELAVFDANCLKEIASFLEKITNDHYSHDPRQLSITD